MRVTKFETFLANAGSRNYLFVRLTTDAGVAGVGEASLEWQEKTVQTLLHEWVEPRILGQDPRDVVPIIDRLIRDQYQGGSTIMTAISGVEIALWDVVGKACGQPIHRLLGGRYRDSIPAYANGWYGGADSPKEFAEMARDVAARGYRAMKFDPFGAAWKELSIEERDAAVDRTAAVREAVGDDVGLMIEFHGRLSAGSAIDMIGRLERFHPLWCEEPVTPDSIDLLAEVKRRVTLPLAAGERLYTLSDFHRLISMRAVDVVQMDVAHCGGIWISRLVAGMAAVCDIEISPHCSIGPVALAACLQVDACSPNIRLQECFAEFDVPWRRDFVRGNSPIRDGVLTISDEPGLGIELDEQAIVDHPYVAHCFPSLWDKDWVTNFASPRDGGQQTGRIY